MYSLIGRAVVKLSVLYVKRRYGRGLAIGAAAGALGVLGAAAYWASRDVPEG